MTEGADPKFVWDDDGRELSARAAININAAMRGHLSGIEALEMTIFPPDDPDYTALVKEKAASLPFGERAERTRMSDEERRQRERDKYANDEEYRQRRLEQFRARRQTPEFKEKERLRARARRAKARASS